VVEAHGASQCKGIAQYGDGDSPPTSLPPPPDLQTVEGAGSAVDRHLQGNRGRRGAKGGAGGRASRGRVRVVGPLFLHQMNGGTPRRCDTSSTPAGPCDASTTLAARRYTVSTPDGYLHQFFNMMATHTISSIQSAIMMHAPTHLICGWL
jgi:hypothetical protein